MKYFNIIFIVIVSVNLCNAQSNNATLVFIDRSTSVDSFKNSKAFENEVLESILENRIIEIGDLFAVSFICTNTANAKNLTGFTYLPDVPDFSDLKRIEKERAEEEYYDYLGEYNEWYSQKIFGYIDINKVDKSRTNLFGSLKIISDFLEDNNDKSISIYYISDMIPCSNIACYFCKKGKNIHDYKAAESYAKNDLEKAIKFYPIDKSVFSSIGEVNIILMGTPLSNAESMTFMPHYWKTVFKALGVPAVNIN